MRISDWSSDVCSSDLVEGGEPAAQPVIETLVGARTVERPEIGDLLDDADQRDVARRIGTDMAGVARIEIAADRAGADCRRGGVEGVRPGRSEEHTTELQTLMRITYADLCLQKKKKHKKHTNIT